MDGQPFYHIRPNKYVDRQIFVQILKALNRQVDISKYVYVGMGSYTFEDYKLLHKEIGINRMISLENNPKCFRRANYNKPLRCITLVPQSTTDYIANMDSSTDQFVFWLDYTAPKEIGKQFDDFCRLISKLNEHDIVRITVNANPAALGNPSEPGVGLWEYRLGILKERLGEFVPPSVVNEDMTKARYPLALLSCLEKASMDTLADQSKSLLPLMSSIYDDNTQMLTMTCVVIKNSANTKAYKKNTDLKRFCNFSWNNPLMICMPPLTTKEVLQINNELPTKSNGKLIAKKFDFIFGGDEVGLKSYLKYYREYPHFHSVNF